MAGEVRKINGRIVLQSCSIGKKEVLLCDTGGDVLPQYSVALHDINTDRQVQRLFTIESSNDYLAMLSAFADTIKQQTHTFKMKQHIDGIEDDTIGYNFVTKDEKQDYTGKLVCLWPSALKPEYRMQAHQVILVQKGKGCEPDNPDDRIVGVEIATGSIVQYLRSDVQGIFDSEKLPAWVQERMDKPEFLFAPDSGNWLHLLPMVFYCPIKGALVRNSKDGEIASEESSKSLLRYKDQIQEAIANDEYPWEDGRGCMHNYYCGGGNPIDRKINWKVWYYHPNVKIVGDPCSGELYGIVQCWLREPLTNEEYDYFKTEVTNDLAFGWGKEFERWPIKTEDGELYVSFWTPDDNWALIEESAFEQHPYMKGMTMV